MENKSCNQRSLVSSRTKCFEIEFLRLGLMLSNNRLTSIHVTLPFSAHITIFITCFPGSIWTMLPTLSRICQDYWSCQFPISSHSSPAECDVYTCTPVYTWTPFVSDANYYLKSFLRSCPAFSAISRGNDYNGKKRNPRSHNIRLDEINLNFIQGWQLCWFCLLKDSILESDAFLPALLTR